jgi:hypothetical protein
MKKMKEKLSAQNTPMKPKNPKKEVSLIQNDLFSV